MMRDRKKTESHGTRGGQQVCISGVERQRRGLCAEKAENAFDRLGSRWPRNMIVI